MVFVGNPGGVLGDKAPEGATFRGLDRGRFPKRNRRRCEGQACRKRPARRAPSVASLPRVGHPAGWAADVRLPLLGGGCFSTLARAERGSHSRQWHSPRVTRVPALPRAVRELAAR